MWRGICDRKPSQIVRALYGGKSAGTDYWRHVRKAMETMNFQSCKAYLDVWFSPAQRGDGTLYYEYVILYTYDLLVIMEIRLHVTYFGQLNVCPLSHVTHRLPTQDFSSDVIC